MIGEPWQLILDDVLLPYARCAAVHVSNTFLEDVLLGFEL